MIEAADNLRRLVLALTTSLCLLQVQGCGDAKERADQAADRVRFGTGTALQTFDPHRADAGATFSTYISLVYDGLTRTDPDNIGEVRPSLATSWRWVDDYTIEFDLREGVRFIDGEPFNARVAKANIERMLAARGPRVATVASIKSTEAPSEYTFRIHLHYPDPTLLYNLSLPAGMMVSPRAFDKPDLDLDPVGTGAWIYDRANSTIGEVHRFNLNPDYFDGHPKGRATYEVWVLDDGRARLNALISGQVDFAILGPSEAEYAARSGFAISRRSNRWLGMTILDRRGELVPEFADVRVRRALGYAVDRQALADVVLFGFAQPASQPMAELGNVSALKDYYTYDPAKARALLEEANAVGFRFEVPVMPANSAEFETIQHYLKQVGINMEIKIIEPGSVTAIARSLQYPINTIGFPVFDPDNRHTAIWGSGATFNAFRIDNSRLDELASQARQTKDEEVRKRLFEEYFDIVVRDGHSVIYLHTEDIVAYDAGKLFDVQVSRYIDPMLREVKLRSALALSPDQR